MSRTISARLSEAETEALDTLAKQKGVSRSQLLASIAKQAVNAEAKQGEESERSSLTEAIMRIGDRLDKIDADFCSRFPELCERLESIEQRVPPRIEHGSDKWKAQRKADLEHVLFEECPNCSPIRDEVLKAKGKRLVDLEIKLQPDVEKAEPETSPSPKKGFKWDWDRMIYVKRG